MAKFTEEQAIEALNGKFATQDGKTSLQLSERSVKETLSALYPLAGDEMELTTFIDTIAFNAVDTMNRNFIHESSEFAKNYKPTKVEKQKPSEGEGDKITPETLAETVKAAVAEAVKPYKEELDKMTSTRDLAARKDDINAKKAELKLSKAWDVDFNNSVTIAEFTLGDTATAQQIFDKAKELFNATLSARGEKYEPRESSGEPGKSDFTAAAERRKKEKERRDKSNS